MEMSSEIEISSSEMPNTPDLYSQSSTGTTLVESGDTYDSGVALDIISPA